VVLWRISNHPSLTGQGGLRVSGRWHTRGRPIVYCAMTPAAALLETLVHFEIELHDLPIHYRMMKIDVPADIAAERLRLEELPNDWTADVTYTRSIGDTWLARGSSACLAVPSSIVPETFNVLVNPAHRDAKRIAIAHVTDYAIDPRLLN
jgi:RES domain-containing protein